MPWHSRLPIVEHEFDEGDLHLIGTTIGDTRFNGCRLSASHEKRSTFVDCRFQNIRLHRCAIGAAVFERCQFENVWVSGNPALLGTLFLECQCRGQIKGVNFGFDDLDGSHAVSMIKDNLKRARKASYCLDLSNAKCEALSFQHDLLVERVRFRERQCLILSADDLPKRAKKLYHSTTDPNLHLILICCFQGIPIKRVLTLVEREAEPQLDEYITAIVQAGIKVQTTPLC